MEDVVQAATYGADLWHVVIFGATPCVMYGAGDVWLAHLTDESVPLEDVVTATTTVAVTIVRWCGVEEG
jgi:acetylornithine deacetylase